MVKRSALSAPLVVVLRRQQHHRQLPQPKSSSIRRRSIHAPSSSSSLSFVGGILAWYSRKLDQAPLTTKCFSSGIVASTGDIICQIMTTNHYNDEDGSSNTNANTSTTTTWWDWKRTCRFFIMGCFWVAPCTHYWYNTLNTRLVPGTATVARVTQRVLLDQVLFAPLFCPSFMGLLWLLEGRRPTYDDLGKDLIEVTPDIIRANWIVWIPANAVNFSVVPLKLQVLYGNVVALCWNVFLSYKSQWRRDDGKHPVDEEVQKSRIEQSRVEQYCVHTKAF
jgi:protein Mpv17